MTTEHGEIRSCEDALNFALTRDFAENRLDAATFGAELYRGHDRATYELVPPLYREPVGADWEWYERRLEGIFEKQAVAYLTKEPKSRTEWAVIARHHGVPTRLLDWTVSPLIALWFAVSGSLHEDGALFKLQGPFRSSDDAFPPPPHPDAAGDYQKIVRFVPPGVSPRVAAQGSRFTSQASPTGSDEFVPLERLDLALARATVPGDAKPRLLRELTRLGVDRFTIYPDLDGLGSWIRELHEEQHELQRRMRAIDFGTDPGE